MNKKTGFRLGTYNILSFIASFFCMWLCISNHENSYLFRNSFFLLGAVLGILFISIEVFLFLSMKNKSRVFYIFYMIIDLLLGVILTIKIPYAGFYVFAAFKLIKEISRIQLTKKIYSTTNFRKYSRLLGISFESNKAISKDKRIIPNEGALVIRNNLVKKTNAHTRKSLKKATV